MHDGSELEILKLFKELAEKNGSLFVLKGSMVYGNPLGFDSFPSHRIEDIDVVILSDKPYLAVKDFIECMRKRGYNIEVDESVCVEFPDHERKIIDIEWINFKALKNDPKDFLLSLFFGRIYGSEKPLKKLEECLHEIDEDSIEERILYHYHTLFIYAEELAKEGDPKFYKKLAELSRMRGERPEIQEAFLQKFEGWEKYKSSKGEIRGEALKKLMDEWETISESYSDSNIFHLNSKLIIRRGELNGIF